jgi:hypothetical protein
VYRKRNIIARCSLAELHGSRQARLGRHAKEKEKEKEEFRQGG